MWAGDFNWLAILVSGLAVMVIGSAWYGAFSKPWMEAAGISAQNLKASFGYLHAEAFDFGEFRLEPGTRRLVRGGEPVALTSGEFALLHALVTHARQPMSRDKLMELARGREIGAFDRSIDVQVSRLRKLIEPDPAKPRFIQTVWGFGYVFVPDSQ